jgi:pimeloyl-ACP methyl ester carboxylesterase
MNERDTIQPVSFGPADRRLFGIIHFPADAARSGLGVVLCNPFGQEAVRAHRMWRVLAERLARAGHAVMRFDYFGTGDSMGDDAQGDLEGWCGDLMTAHSALMERCGCLRVVWVGMRLGAAVARLAAARSPAALARLVLWDPVIDGATYLAHLRERHVASLECAFSLAQSPSPSLVALDPTRFQDEAIGFAISPALRRQVGELTPDTLQWPQLPAGVVLISDPNDVTGRSLASMSKILPAGVVTIVLSHGTDWTTDTAGNTSLVPTAALLQLVKHVGDAT